MLKRIHALWILGSAMILVIIRRLLRPRATVQSFEDHYGTEGLLAVTDEEHRLLQLANRCTGCGKCDLDGSGRLILFALAGSRSLPDADAASALLRDYSQASLAEAESRCPEAVPFVPLATLIRSHATRRPHPG